MALMLGCFVLLAILCSKNEGLSRNRGDSLTLSSSGLNSLFDGESKAGRASGKFRDDVSLSALERRARKKHTRYTIFAVESPAGFAELNFEATIKFVKTSLDLISEFDHYPEVKFFVDRKHRAIHSTEEFPYRYSLISIDLARNHSTYNFQKIADFIRSSSDFIHKEKLQLFVNAADGRTINVDADVSETIDNVKAKIHEKAGIPPHLQRLEFEGQTLLNERRLYDYNISPNSALDLKHNIEVLVRMSPSLVVNLKATPVDTVVSLKQKLLELGIVTLDKIKLEFHGQDLQNERHLRDYNVTTGSVIQAILIR